MHASSLHNKESLHDIVCDSGHELVSAVLTQHPKHPAVCSKQGVTETHLMHADAGYKAAYAHAGSHACR